MRHEKIGIALGAVAAALLVVTPASAAAPAPAAQASTSCPTVYWGSLAKTGSLSTHSTIQDLRTGRHLCFDRLVIDLAGPAASYSARYVSELTGIGSGLPVATTGGANLEILVQAPTAPGFNPGAKVKNLGYTTFRQLVWLGSFEGQTKVGISTRARLPMRVFTLAGPGDGSRLVIDVAHHW
ncbi:hypothetical protein ATK23_1991 [Glutamicibacter mysorens]|uniref:AMIN-like domain-containing protein n=1 Tax=Glutamicibacter mysorens TaxID=257984 RepID=A0ABX4MZC7_9MICC|nr:hypothetical protein [Glutamicibacter mysorens]PJJ44748.1 hypothetical protein ATK23_1991 [Glutamicibacter mysorens]